jgi:hypothetical protein
MPWGLILKLIFMLPSIIPTVIKIWKLIRDFEIMGFWSIAALIRDILNLILGLAPLNKIEAKNIACELEGKSKSILFDARLGKVKVDNTPQQLVKLKEKAARFKANAIRNKRINK